jgi:hypothetical protein
LDTTLLTGLHNANPLAGSARAVAQTAVAERPKPVQQTFEDFQIAAYAPQPPAPVQRPPAPPVINEQEREPRKRKPSNIKYLDRRLPDNRLERVASAKPGHRIVRFIYTFDPDNPNVSGRTMTLETQPIRQSKKRKDDSHA